MTQLSFQWPLRPSYAPQDFFVSDANVEAVRFLETWPEGHSSASLLSGPKSCGKTHLASAWAVRTQASLLDAGVLGKTSSEELWGGARHAVLEDIHAITHETALFHLMRHAETQGCALLLTSNVSAAQLHFALADVRSRLLALPQVAVHAPDEALLRGFLLKSFADRQLRVGKDVIDYLLKRMERSFTAARELVELLEKHALASGRSITVALARTIVK